eukprot:722323-Pleurochrysis_carterae.AAC.1
MRRMVQQWLVLMPDWRPAQGQLELVTSSVWWWPVEFGVTLRLETRKLDRDVEITTRRSGD